MEKNTSVNSIEINVANKRYRQALTELNNAFENLTTLSSLPDIEDFLSIIRSILQATDDQKEREEAQKLGITIALFYEAYWGEKQPVNNREYQEKVKSIRDMTRKLENTFVDSTSLYYDTQNALSMLGFDYINNTTEKIAQLPQKKQQMIRSLKKNIDNAQKNKNGEKLIQYYHDYLHYLPNDYLTLLNLGQAYFNMLLFSPPSCFIECEKGESPQTVATIRFTELNEKNQTYFYHTKHYLTEALTVSPKHDHAKIFKTLAELHDFRGDYTTAVYYYKKYCALERKNFHEFYIKLTLEEMSQKKFSTLLRFAYILGHRSFVQYMKHESKEYTLSTIYGYYADQYLTSHAYTNEKEHKDDNHYLVNLIANAALQYILLSHATAHSENKNSIYFQKYHSIILKHGSHLIFSHIFNTLSSENIRLIQESYLTWINYNLNNKQLGHTIDKFKLISTWNNLDIFSIDFLTNIGKTCIEIEDFDTAITAYTFLLEKEPHNIQTKTNLELATLMLSARSAEKAGQDEMVVEYYNAALSLNTPYSNINAKAALRLAGYYLNLLKTQRIKNAGLSRDVISEKTGALFQFKPSPLSNIEKIWRDHVESYSNQAISHLTRCNPKARANPWDNLYDLNLMTINFDAASDFAKQRCSLSHNMSINQYFEIKLEALHEKREEKPYYSVHSLLYHHYLLQDESVAKYFQKTTINSRLMDLYLILAIQYAKRKTNETPFSDYLKAAAAQRFLLSYYYSGLNTIAIGSAKNVISSCFFNENIFKDIFGYTNEEELEYIKYASVSFIKHCIEKKNNDVDPTLYTLLDGSLKNHKPNNADYFFILASIHWLKKNLGDAILAYESCLEIDPNHSDAKTKRAQLLKLRELKEVKASITSSNTGFFTQEPDSGKSKPEETPTNIV